jgi:hypothetical protein
LRPNKQAAHLSGIAPNAILQHGGFEPDALQKQLQVADWFGKRAKLMTDKYLRDKNYDCGRAAWADTDESGKSLHRS